MLEFLRNLFSPLFDALGWLLLTFHEDFGAPWWLAIVMLTICVRAVLLPLTVRQTKSMRAMQALRPEMDAMREKHKGEPQKLQQEMMKLYQERKVNPLGGCLPVVVQLPIFLVLYYTIREFEALDSFRTGGLFWFTDLTAPDTLYILPVLYVATMMASQEVTLRNTPMQAQQKMIMRFLPVAFGFFLAGFPAGLLVYWIASNVITFVQNVVIYRLYPIINHEAPTEDPLKTPEKPAAPNAISDSDSSNAKPKNSGSNNQSANARKRRRKKSRNRR